MNTGLIPDSNFVTCYDLVQMKQFLNLLDLRAAQYHFQTFDDVKDRKDRSLNSSFQSTLEDALPHFLNLSGRRAGTFVAVNEIAPGKPRRKENVVRFRAIWQDQDGEDADKPFPLTPSMEVQTSPGRWQRYWFPEGDDLHENEFEALMKVMVESYRSDSRCKSSNGVLRLPGSLHNKREPFLVQIVRAPGYRYPKLELLEAFGARPRQSKRKARKVPSTTATPSADRARVFPTIQPEDLRRLRSALATLPSDDYDTWLRYGMAIYDYTGGSPEGEEIWREYSAKCEEKFDPLDQEHRWGNEFRERAARQRGNPVTVATIFRDARLAGWIDPEFDGGLDADGAERCRLKQIDVRKLLWQPKRLPSAPVLDAIQWRFDAVGHKPSVAHMGGIEQIVLAMLGMAADALHVDRYLLTALAPGIGKSTAIAETIRYLCVHPNEFNDPGIIVFVDQLRDVKGFVGLLGDIPKSDYSCVTADEDINVLGSDDPNAARVIIATQAGLELQCKQGRAFSNLPRYYYEGRPRDVRIWDETITPTFEHVLDYDELQKLPSELRINPPTRTLTDLVNGFLRLIADTPHGSVIQVPKIAMNYKTFTGTFVDDRERQTAETLYAMNGEAARVDKSGDGTKVLSYTRWLPADLAPMLISDASGHFRQTYPLWAETRNNLSLLISPPKWFTNLRIYRWDRGAGKTVHRNQGEVARIAESIGEAINRLPAGERALVIHRKEDYRTRVSMIEAIKSHLDETRIKEVEFLHWGCHKGTNEYADIKHVFIIGLHNYLPAAYEAIGRAVTGLNHDEEFDKQSCIKIQIGELQHNLFQAACRSMIRRADGDDCPAGCSLHIIGTSLPHKGLTDDQIREVFPGASITPWNTKKKKLSKNEKKFINALVEAVTKVGTSITLSRTELSALTDVSYSNCRYLNNENVIEALSKESISVEKSHGSITLQMDP